MYRYQDTLTKASQGYSSAEPVRCGRRLGGRGRSARLIFWHDLPVLATTLASSLSFEVP